MKKAILFSMIMNIWFICAAEAEGLQSESRTFRCNKGLVSINDTFYEVREKCGQPTAWGSGMWIYDFGTTSFIYRLEFKNSLVFKIINTGNYGTEKK